MRFVLVALLVAACGSDDDAPSSEEKIQSCGDTRDCTMDDEGCAQFPYEQLPSRCFDICYSHYCCSYANGVWGQEVYDCAPPMADAGVDAP